MTKYHVLKRVTDQGGTHYVSMPATAGYTTLEAVQVGGKMAAEVHPDEYFVLVKEIGTVSVEPVIKLFDEPAPEVPVYRGNPVLESQEPGPARAPQKRPRLLVIPDRQATPGEITGHLMVVAEGRIVKNSFGALELEDMPLTPEERVAVLSAMGTV